MGWCSAGNRGGLIVERWYGDCRMPLAVPRHRLALRLGGGRCGRVCNRLGVGRGEMMDET